MYAEKWHVHNIEHMYWMKLIILYQLYPDIECFKLGEYYTSTGFAMDDTNMYQMHLNLIEIVLKMKTKKLGHWFI